MSSRVLVVTWDGSGNLPPTLALARELASRGHDVRFLAHASQARRIGFPFRTYQAVPNLYDRAQVPAEEIWWEELFLAEESGAELLGELERAPADLVVVDCLLWGALAAAERAAVRACVLVHSLYGRRFEHEDRPARRARLNRTRDALGVGAAVSLLEPWERAALVVVASSRTLDAPPGPLPPNVVYAGPLRPSDTEAADLPWQPDVVVSFSSAPLRVPRTTQRVLDALAPMPLRCAVASSLDGLRPGANTALRAWLPHDAVLPRASVAVTHGGHGSVLAALRHGVPLLCLPLLADQPFVARRVEESGAGLALPPSAPPQEIRDAVHALVSEPRYRAAARALGRAIAAELDEAAHLPALEGLLQAAEVRG